MKFSLISAATLFASTIKAESLLNAIDYQNTLDVYYYFTTGDATVSVSDDGILINVENSEDLCSVLAGAEIIYSADSEEDVLLTSNCLSIYNLVDSSDKEITWSSCQEFSFYDSLCPSSDSSSDSSSNSSSITTTKTNTEQATFVNNDQTSVLSTVTTTIDGVVTEYTTYCPLTTSSTLNSDDIIGYKTSTIVSTSDGIVSTQVSSIPVSCTAGAPAKVFVEVSDIEDDEESTLTTVTSTINGEVTIYTTYCPLTEESASTVESEGASTIYSTIVSVITSTKQSTTYVATETQTTTIVVQVSSGSTAKVASTAAVTTTTIEAQSSSSNGTSYSTAAVVSTFEGAGSRLINSISIVTFVSVFFGLLF